MDLGHAGRALEAGTLSVNRIFVQRGMRLAKAICVGFSGPLCSASPALTAESLQRTSGFEGSREGRSERTNEEEEEDVVTRAQNGQARNQTSLGSGNSFAAKRSSRKGV